MSVTLAVRFPLGRYHATAWDRNINEGAVEWPPSPWRLLRALVSAWYTRWPELPAHELDRLLEALGDPPSYWTAPVWPGHSRHYLPDVDHKKSEPRSTNLTLDPYLHVDRDEVYHLLVRWDTQLSDEQRSLLAKFAGLVPYLGRSESVCEISLIDDASEPDETWWRPGQSGAETTRLLAPSRPVSRPVLELTSVAVRKGRRTMPEHTVWVTYGRTHPVTPPSGPRTREAKVESIRFGIASRAPFRATHGVLLSDRLHRIVTQRLDGGRLELLGHAGAPTNHSHAHWVPLPSSAERGATLDGLLVWVPSGMSLDEVSAIITVRELPGRRRGRRGEEGYETKGFPDTTLLLQSVGPVWTIAPELCGPARVWISRTPYLPVRHRKRESLDEFLAVDVRRELAYRGRSEAVNVERVYQDEGISDRWSLSFRRYRADEKLTDARRGVALRLTFSHEVEGPLLLGQLSHFGYGLFVPQGDQPGLH